jgi:hypothetical protein
MDQSESSDTTQTPLELQELLRSRLKDARAHYDQCSHEFRDLAAKFKEGLLQAPEGSDALRIARMRESAALEEYIQVLQMLGVLLTEGRIPEG